MFTFRFKSIANAVVRSIPPLFLTLAVSHFATDVYANPSEGSAFKDYKKLDDPGVTDWRASNDKVRTLGGWRTYLKEAYEAPEPPVAPSARPEASPVEPAAVSPAVRPASGHSHHQHGGEK